MGLLSLPHWLIIAGAILVAMGFVGLALTRNKEAGVNSHTGPPAPLRKMPPLPRLLESSRHEDNEGPVEIKARKRKNRWLGES